MFLFLKLILAHLIADFILQFEELYHLKVRHFAGHTLHVVIHGTVTALLLFPYLNEPVILGFIALLTVEHLLQDTIKYHLTKKFPAKRFAYYMTDQICHLAFLCVIFLIPFANEARPLPGPALLNFFYLDSGVTSFAIFFIILTFAASYTLNSFYQSYVPGPRPLHWITSPEITIAIAERSVIAGAVIFLPGLGSMALALAAGLLRLPFKNLRNWNDFLVSAAWSLAVSAAYLGLS